MNSKRMEIPEDQKRLRATKCKIRKLLPPAGPLLFQDKIATTQEISQTLLPCFGWTTGSDWPGSDVRSAKSS